MSVNRISEKNSINSRIKELTIYNDADSRSLCRFRNMSSDDGYVIKQVEKLTKAINDRAIEIKELEDRLVNLENGELDDELLGKMRKNTIMANEKGLATIKRKIEEKEIDKEDKKKSLEYYNADRKSDISIKHGYKSSQRHFFRACDSIPDYMKQELKRMPCNEGFVWKSVYCFGELPANNNARYIITENKKGFKLITEWDNTYTYEYKKESRKAKVLLKKTLRKKKS